MVVVSGGSHSNNPEKPLHLAFVGRNKNIRHKPQINISVSVMNKLLRFNTCVLGKYISQNWLNPTPPFGDAKRLEYFMETNTHSVADFNI